MTEKCADRTYRVGAGEANSGFAGHALKAMHNTRKVCVAK